MATIKTTCTCGAVLMREGIIPKSIDCFRCGAKIKLSKEGTDDPIPTDTAVPVESDSGEGATTKSSDTLVKSKTAKAKRTCTRRK